MADHVYRRFTRENLFTTTILAQNHVSATWVSQINGWSSGAYFTNLPGNTLSLYGGIRSRKDVGVSGTAGVHLYPLDQVDTQSIDGVIQIPGQYPATGSLNLVWCVNVAATQAFAETDTFWMDTHHSVVRRLSDWYTTHKKHVYPTEDEFLGIGVGVQTPSGAFACVHIPSMFYGREIASGSVLFSVNSFSGSAYSPGSGTLFWKDDGYGRLWEVPSTASDWTAGTHVVGNIFYNEGLIVLTHPSATWHQQFLSGAIATVPWNVNIQFNGSYHIKSMIALCRMSPGDVNASNNPTYFYTDETGKRWARNTVDSKGNVEAVTYVTAIGLYNEERQLVAVAKIAQPIRKREKDDIDIKLRMDL